MNKRCVILKKGREASLLRRHPWIFSGSVEKIPSDCIPGELLPVYSYDLQFLAQAFFHPKQSLIGRVFSFDAKESASILETKIDVALDLRKKLFNPAITNAYRLINSDGDGLSGLIVDIYDRVVVIQIGSYGIERLKTSIIEILIRKLKPSAIYEKSNSSSRLKEGLKASNTLLFGHLEKEVPILENGLSFLVDVEEGQKTGFFLDQREMRALVRRLTKGKRVLNTFSYTGGFSINALAGGAKGVVSVDTDKRALELAQKNTTLNGFSLDNHQLKFEDAFVFLRKDALDFDFILLDPPAFAKKREDVEAALKAYKEINLQVLLKIPPKSFLLTSSCSYYVDFSLFQKQIYAAALEAKRSLQVLSQHIPALDHPISLFHPEGAYIKSLLLYVS